MAVFEIRDSLRAYFTEKPIANAVDALSEVLQGNAPPLMTWDEARNYNQALLMAAQVRADHNEMLFELWERTFGAALKLHRRSFVVEFEAEYCTPSQMWNGKHTWKTISPKGLEDEDVEDTYELVVEHCNGLIFLAIDRWNTEEEYVDFSFNHKKIQGNRWAEHKGDDGIKRARMQPITLTDLFDDPEVHISDMQDAAETMIDYLAKIIWNGVW